VFLYEAEVIHGIQKNLAEKVIPPRWKKGFN